MSTARQVVRVIGRLMTSRLIYRVCVGLSVIQVSNYLIGDPSLIDAFDVALSAVSIIMIMSEVGMSMVIMRHGAQQGKVALQRFYGTGLVIESTTWLLLQASILGGYVLINGVTRMFWLLLILGIGQALIQYRVVIRSAYRAIHHNEWISFVEVLDGISKLVGVWLITHYLTDLTTGALSIAVLYAVTTLIFVGWYALHSFKLVPPQFDQTLLKPMLGEGIWFSMQAVVTTIYFEIDKLILRFYQLTGWADIPAGDIGRYGAASRIIVFLLIFPRIGLQVITPYLYEYYKTDLTKYRRVVLFSMRYLGAVGIALGVGLTALADQVMQLVYKESLWSATPALELFGLFFAVRLLGTTSSQVFATIDQQPLRTKLEAGSVVVNIILDIILIPQFGFLGGAMATLSTEILIQTVMYILAKRFTQDSYWLTLWKLLPAAVAGAVMYGGIIFLKPHIPLPVSVLAGGTIYCLVLVALRFFNKTDWEILRPKSTATHTSP
ncbi:MAG: polysaccharide biosynthesis C-terminal domain-containing protein [Candidatus Kerfeldbacteria bacterium]|nr:polysaccharide biosynthesis C-terminal domain-containing protein [Candidatus Kerfeldbacteria bacterium]